MAPTITVVVPVFNRQEKLERALRSISGQSFTDFECLVVDDCSTVPIEPIVERLNDPRFVYLRTDENGGPSAARFHGYRAMRGSFLAAVDSDDEARPQMLASAIEHLRAWPDVGGVAGMTARADDGVPRVRIPAGHQVLTSEAYRTTRQLPDCAGVVRREVVELWLRGRHDYYAFEAQQWLTFHLRFSMLFVDEVWVDVHLDGLERVSRARDPRSLLDYVRFFDENHGRLGDTKCVALDAIVEEAWFQLARARWKSEARSYAAWMRERGSTRAHVLGRRVAAKLQRIAQRDSPPTRWLE